MIVRRGLLPLLLTAVVLLASVLSVQAQNDYTYQENFSSDSLNDVLHSSAVWDTGAGEIRLGSFGSLAEVGSYDTVGSGRDISLSGNYAFVADYTNGLVVLDIQDPNHPLEVAHIDPPGTAVGLAVAGNTVYLANGTAGLAIIDVSDPLVPVLLSTLGTSGFVADVIVANDRVYLASNTIGVDIVDISDKSTPVLLGSYTGISSASSLVLAGYRLYVADFNTGLAVLDVSDPTTPYLAGSYATGGKTYDVAVDGNRAYIAVGSDGIQVVDVTNPAAPLLLATPAAGGDTRRLVLAGDYLVASDLSDGLVILDVSDPLMVTTLSSAAVPFTGRTAQVAGDIIYAAADNSGVKVFQGAQSVPLSLVGNATAGTPLGAVVVAGNVAYLGSSTGQVVSFDITNPESPTPVGIYVAGSSVQGLAVSGDLLLVADEVAGFVVLDVSNPSNMTQLYQYVLPGLDVVVQGGFAVVAAQNQGVYGFDVSDPADIRFISGFNNGVEYANLAADGEYYYGGLVGGDISIFEYNPTAGLFSLVSTILQSWSAAADVAVSGNLLYATTSFRGLGVYDVSDPATPVLLDSIDLGSEITDIKVTGNDLFAALGSGGIAHVGVTYPNQLYLIDELANETGGSVTGLALAGDYLFFGDSTLGLGVAGAYQRHFSMVDNEIWSTVFATPPQDVVQARIVTTTQVGDVRWELSADDGNYWKYFAADGSWSFPETFGNQLRWRATLKATQPLVSASCTDLQIEWLYAGADISAITDVPGDQGRQVSLSWRRSGWDDVGSPIPIMEYAVYRRIAAAGSQTEASGAEKIYPEGDWHFVMTVPADAEASYAVVVPTLGDSTIADGQYFSTFFVRARTATPGVYFDALPDSGYSVDNLAPSVPSGVKMAPAEQLVWDQSEAADFRYFTVYGSTTSALDGTSFVIGQTTGIALDVSGQHPAYFLVTATDFAGNESAPAMLDMVSAVTGDRLPTRTALRGNYPNPFNPATTVSFDLRVATSTRLTVFDVSGRVVRTLVAGQQLAGGRHDVTWDGLSEAGRPVSAGVYLYRLEAGDFQQTRTMTLVK